MNLCMIAMWQMLIKLMKWLIEYFYWDSWKGFWAVILPSWSQRCCPKELLCEKLTRSSHLQEGSYWLTGKQDRWSRVESSYWIMLRLTERITVMTMFTSVIQTPEHFSLIWSDHDAFIRLWIMFWKLITQNSGQWGMCVMWNNLTLCL